MPDIENTFRGIVSGKSREQITADEMSDSLRDIAHSIELHVDLADKSARDAAVSAAKSEHRAKMAEIRGWLSVGISAIAVIISLIALLR